MPLNQNLSIQMKRHLRINRLLLSLLLERNRRLEHIILGQVEFDPIRRRRRRSEHVACFGDGLGKEFGHAIELGFDTVEASSDGNGIV